MITEIGKVYRTRDYLMFNYMNENRAITDTRKGKVRKSIKTNGYIFNPIIVNEKKEIIDGQARFEVLRDLGLPIDYIVCHGLTAKDCSALNAYTTAWSQRDYIESYMHQGNKDYSYLFTLVSKYEQDGIGINSVVFAINGSVESQSQIIKDGSFKCTDEQYESASELLAYLKKFMPAMKRHAKGINSRMCAAIMFAAKMNLVDCDRLLDKFNLYYGSDIAPYFTTMETAFKTLNEIYNYHRSAKVHLEIEYEKYQSNRLTWYSAKWGNRHATHHAENSTPTAM